LQIRYNAGRLVGHQRAHRGAIILTEKVLQIVPRCGFIGIERCKCRRCL
jgi:hypothetical protein